MQVNALKTIGNAVGDMVAPKMASIVDGTGATLRTVSTPKSEVTKWGRDVVAELEPRDAVRRFAVDRDGSTFGHGLRAGSELVLTKAAAERALVAAAAGKVPGEVRAGVDALVLQIGQLEKVPQGLADALKALRLEAGKLR